MAEVELIRGDLTKQQVDVIVNAANSGLHGGGGVDGAIHRAGGPGILEECRVIISEIGSLSTGKVVSTSAGNLPCRYVFHAVGPVYDASRPLEMQRLLFSCYWNCLELATEMKLDSIAFPNISTGVYGYPKYEAAATAIAATYRFLSKPNALQKIGYVCFDAENFDIYKQLLA